MDIFEKVEEIKKISFEYLNEQIETEVDEIKTIIEEENQILESYEKDVDDWYNQIKNNNGRRVKSDIQKYRILTNKASKVEIQAEYLEKLGQDLEKIERIKSDIQTYIQKLSIFNNQIGLYYQNSSNPNLGQEAIGNPYEILGNNEIFGGNLPNDLRQKINDFMEKQNQKSVDEANVSSETVSNQTNVNEEQKAPEPVIETGYSTEAPENEPVTNSQVNPENSIGNNIVPEIMPVPSSVGEASNVVTESNEETSNYNRNRREGRNGTKRKLVKLITFAPNALIHLVEAATNKAIGYLKSNQEPEPTLNKDDSDNNLENNIESEIDSIADALERKYLPPEGNVIAYGNQSGTYFDNSAVTSSSPEVNLAPVPGSITRENNQTLGSLKL